MLSLRFGGKISPLVDKRTPFMIDNQGVHFLLPSGVQNFGTALGCSKGNGPNMPLLPLMSLIGIEE